MLRRLAIGPEIAFSNDSLIATYDLRFDISLLFTEHPVLFRVFKLCFDLLFSQIGKWRSAASSAKILLQFGHCFLISYRRCLAFSKSSRGFLRRSCFFWIECWRLFEICLCEVSDCRLGFLDDSTRLLIIFGSRVSGLFLSLSLLANRLCLKRGRFSWNTRLQISGCF